MESWLKRSKTECWHSMPVRIMLKTRYKDTDYRNSVARNREGIQINIKETPFSKPFLNIINRRKRAMEGISGRNKVL